MKKIEMVRCMVKSPGAADRDAKSGASLRYVPSEIFRLWRYLMEQVKDFEVYDAETGVWLDDEMFERDKAGLAGAKTEKVIEISFNYCRETVVGRPVIRYFPEDSFKDIVNIFIQNFSKQHIHGGTRQINGYFIAP